MGKEVEVSLPDIGDFSSVDVIEVLVAPGDRIEAEVGLIVLESDKATMEIPSPYSGVVKSLRVKVGDKISQDAVLLTMELSEDTEAEEAAQAPEPQQPEQPPVETPVAAVTETATERLPGDKVEAAPPLPTEPADEAHAKPHASPAVRRFARQLGVDLLRVQGSAPKGRITREDVQGYVKQTLQGGMAPLPPGGGFALPPIPEVDFSKFGETESKPLGRIKKLSGAHVLRSWLTVPHVTQFDEADITELEAFRQAQKEAAAAQGMRLTLVPFLLRACAALLREMPEFNSSLAADGENLIYKKYCHIGVAVDTPQGLVVPVVRDVERKGVFELAHELAELSERARQGKLLPAELQGGCFTISSLGGIGGTGFTPIVNAPEVAILGVARATYKPVWNGKKFKPRHMLPLSLSYDHRVIDGAQGVRFTTRLGELLSDIRRLLL